MPVLEVKRIIFEHNDILENADDAKLAHFFRTIMMAGIRDTGHRPARWVLMAEDEFSKLTNSLGGIVKDTVKSVEEVKDEISPLPSIE